MVQPSPRRKVWQTALRLVGLLVVAVLISFPISFVAGMALTPLLWRLEPVLGMELAGHSGPSDWIMFGLFGIAMIMVYGGLLWLSRPRATPTQTSESEQTSTT